MIYFVDEDVQYAREFSVPLVLRNLEVKILSDADAAYNTLESATNVDCVIVDIMLATGDAGASRFSSAETDGFLRTGILLMSYLSNCRPTLFPHRFVVLSAAGTSLMLDVKKYCLEQRITVLRKSDFRDPSALADELQKIMKRLA